MGAEWLRQPEHHSLVENEQEKDKKKQHEIGTEKRIRDDEDGTEVIMMALCEAIATIPSL